MLPKSLKSKLVVVHVVEVEGKLSKNDCNVPAHDVRSNKPLGVHSLEDKQVTFFQRIIESKIDKKKVSFAAPNEISLSLNISRKAQIRAVKIKKNLTEHTKFTKKIIINENVSTIYDYLEEIQTSIVFSYKSLESFCNESIPDEYVYKKTNNKGIVEHYSKERIERWIPTSEKLSDILPEIFKCDSPTKEEYWSYFKNLERLRNEIIHSKSSAESPRY